MNIFAVECDDDPADDDGDDNIETIETSGNVEGILNFRLIA